MTRAVPKPTPPSKTRTGASAKRYKDWLSTMRCVATGETPVQLHHVKGPRSFTTGERLPRRKSTADIALVPLAPHMHRLAHDIGDEAFGRDYLGGETALADYALSYLAAYVIEGRA